MKRNIIIKGIDYEEIRSEQGVSIINHYSYLSLNSPQQNELQSPNNQE